MNLAEFLVDSAEKGIVFSIENEKLHCHIPKGLPSQQIAEVIANNKEQIMRLLSRTSLKRRSIHAEQGPITGPVELTPIQRWFFDHQFANQHHWNQCVLLEITRMTAFNDLIAVFQALTRHHDALRFSYHRDQGAWIQQCCEPHTNGSITCFDLVGLGEEATNRKIDQLCNEAQTRFDLTEGALLRAIIFNNVGNARTQRLFITIHHLAIDGVSWRIILEDLTLALAQVARGEPIELPRKSTSYRYWAEQLAHHATSSSVLREIDYWSRQPWHSAKEIPRDFAHSKEAENTILWEEEVSVSLSANDTKRLLQDANAAYRTHIDELLVAALVGSYAQWSGNSEILLTLEGHGRQQFQKDLDLTRTVGWFTTIYPVVLSAHPKSELGQLIKETKETLRQIPNKGLGFGLLRFNVRNPVICGIPAPEIAFNYLGQFAHANAANSLIIGCNGTTGTPRSPSGHRAELITINGIVSAGQLGITFSFSRRIHRRESIVDFAEKLRTALMALIDHCSSTESGGRTPSDFSLVNVSQEQINELESRYRAIDDLWSLTPTQEGFLYTSLAAPDKPFVEQIVFEVRRNFDPGQLERAWGLLQRRHPVLRAVVQFPAEVGILVVKSDEEPKHRYSCVDWRQRPSDERSTETVNLYAKAIQQKGFDLLQQPANRMDVLLLGECRFSVVWTFHHILLDGWSNARVVGEWLALSAGVGESELPPVTSFSAYLSWLQSKDRGAAIAYWVGYLEAIETIGSIGTRKQCAGKHQRTICKFRKTLSDDVSEAFRDLSKKRGVALNTAIQVVWGIVLHKYSDHSRVLFGKTVSGRSADLQDSASIVGLLVNTVPVCIEFGTEGDFWEIADQVQQREAMSHDFDYVSAAEIQKGLGSRKTTLLYESILVFENYPIDKPRGGRLAAEVGEVELVSAAGGETPYLLTLLFMPNDAFAVDVIYDESRIAACYVETIVANLQQLIGEIACRKSRLSDLVAGILVGDRPIINEYGRGFQREYVPPTNRIEEKMLEVWKQTLQVENIGIHDNFFEIGGHSLIAVDLINSMNLASLRCSIRDLTETPSIKGLAERIFTKENLNPAKIANAQKVSLLPIQLEAIEGSSPTDRNALPGVPHFFEMERDINHVALVQALDAWYGQEIFRLRFFFEEGRWLQGPEHADAYPYAPIREFTLDPESDLVQQVVGISLELEQHLSVLQGPTIQIGLIKVGGETRYMLWSLDHLISDFITVNILLTNLNLFYRQVLRRHVLTIPSDNALYDLSKYMCTMADTALVCRETEFWLRHFEIEGSTLAERISTGATSSASSAINEVITQVADEALTGGINKFIVKHRISFEDFCLGIALWAHKCCFSESQLLLRMICNGRDEVCGEVDLTGGAGWFSVRYPATFQLKSDLGQADFLLDIAEQHGQYRVNRKNYGLLRYLNVETASRLAQAEDWSKSVPFNCWGEIASRRNSQGAEIATSIASQQVLREFLRRKSIARREVGFESGDDPTRGLLFFMSEGRFSVQYSFNNSRTDPGHVHQLLKSVAKSICEISGGSV